MRSSFTLRGIAGGSSSVVLRPFLNSGFCSPRMPRARACVRSRAEKEHRTRTPMPPMQFLRRLLHRMIFSPLTPPPPLPQWTMRVDIRMSVDFAVLFVAVLFLPPVHAFVCRASSTETVGGGGGGEMRSRVISLRNIL